jgi:hypothetical protein
MAQNQPNLNQTRQDIKDIAAVTEETFRSVAANIQDMFANALNASDTVIKSFQKDISNSIKSAARESSKLADNFERMNQGVLKQADIQKQLEARAAKLRSIEISIAALKRIGTAEAISQANELNQQYQDLISINESYTKELNNQIRILDEVDKKIGLLGGALGGIGTLMKNLGLTSLSKPINDAIENTKKYKTQQINAQNEIRLTQESINQLNSRNLSDAQLRVGFGGKELKNLIEQKDALEKQNKELDRKSNKYRNLLISLKEEITLVNLTDAIIAKTVQSFLKLDEAQTKFKNLTGGQIPLMDQFNDRLITSIDYIKTAGSLTEQLGVNASAVFSSDTLAAASEMVKAMGMTQEQANKAAIMSQATGVGIDSMNKSLKEGNKQYNSQNRSALAQGAIMREVYSTSTAIAASMGNSVDRIGEAVRRAKDLGLSLSEVEGIASSLLDIESSIAAEFEYEVISGKQINLEAARYYALTNQTEKLTKEIANNQNIISSFASGNRIEQEAAAKALGISRDQLAEMYMADLRRQNLTDEQIAKAMAMDEMDVKRLSTQEAINTSIAKMTELLAGPAQFLTSMLDNAVILYGVMGAIATVMAVNLATSIGKSAIALAGMIPKTATLLGLEVGRAAAAVASASALTLGLGALGIIAGIAAVMAVVNSNTQPRTPSVPGLAEGGTVTSGGNVMVGENGPEMLSLKPGATVTPLTKLNAATVQSPSSPTINNDALGKVIGEHVANAFRQTPVQTIFPDQEYGRRYQQTIAGVTTRKI